MSKSQKNEKLPVGRFDGRTKQMKRLGLNQAAMDDPTFIRSRNDKPTVKDVLGKNHLG